MKTLFDAGTHRANLVENIDLNIKRCSCIGATLLIYQFTNSSGIAFLQGMGFSADGAAQEDIFNAIHRYE